MDMDSLTHQFEKLCNLTYMQFSETIELSLVYALVSIGVYLTFRVSDFPDLTVDGSFPLGAAVSSVLLINNYDPYTAVFFAMLAGVISGLITGNLHVRGKIMALLSGILTMTALYSINLRIMGQPNIALMTQPTIFDNCDNILILSSIVAFTVIAISLFLNSEIGLALRASGINPKSCYAQGIQVGNMKILSLSLSNGLVATAGAIYSQKAGFADISMGTGTIIIGLASVIIGEKILKIKNVFYAVLNCVIGAMLYRISVTAALNADFLGLEPSDLNLVTALIVALAMIVPIYTKKLIRR